MAENLNQDEGEGTPEAVFAAPEAAVRERRSPTTIVRYGHMGLIAEFTNPPHAKIRCGGKVVIQTDRGIELGETVNLTCPGCEKPINRETILRYAETCGPEYLRLNGGRILREATDADLAENRHLRESERERIASCQALIESRGLPMKLVDCEHLFGGERIVFYFMSEGRIDFRDLVRDLAREFQTRIEMRQVGARDEARLVADFETCGRECCCKNFLKTLKPVSMKMAKMQKATLDPSKVSGRCGRLKCCLRFEQDTYEDLDRRLPRLGIRISTQHGDGVIIERQILTQLLQIRTDDNQRVTVPIEDVVALNVPAPPIVAQPEAPNGARGRRERPQRSMHNHRTPSESVPAKSAAAGPGAAESSPPAQPQPEAAGNGDRPSPSGERRGRRRRRGRRGGEPDERKDRQNQGQAPATEAPVAEPASAERQAAEPPASEPDKSD